MIDSGSPSSDSVIPVAAALGIQNTALPSLCGRWACQKVQESRNFPKRLLTFRSRARQTDDLLTQYLEGRSQNFYALAQICTSLLL
jgi:hypothetical protein